MALQQSRNVGMRISILGVAFFMLFICVSTLSAQGVSSIAQGFQTDDSNVRPGALTALKSGTPNTVELATADNLERLVGVVGEDSLIELSDGETTVNIVTSGNTPTLVSDINGPVAVGDRITSSPIAGVGMRASSSGLVIATAQSALKDAVTDKVKVKDKTGQEQTVTIGTIQAQVDKVFFVSPDEQNSFIPGVVQDFANTLAGRQVSPLRVVMASLLGVLIFVSVSVLIYSAVRSSMISIGRNPLSEPAVHKGLLEVGMSVMGVVLFASIVIYLILTTS